MLPYTGAGVTRTSYVSYFPSRYHTWLCQLGYPQLDVMELESGEWFIYEYLNAPIIPTLTRWQPVLVGMKNIEITFPFLKRYCERLDLQRREAWALIEAREKELDEEHDAVERAAIDKAERATKLVMRNDGLKERIARNGIGEMDLTRLARHVSRWGAQLDRWI